MPKKQLRAAYPSAIEREYTKSLMKAVNALIKSLNDGLDDLFKSIRLDDFDVIKTFGDNEDVRQWITKADNDSLPYFEAAIASAIKSGADVSKMTQRQLMRILKGYYGLNIFPNEPDLLVELAKFEAENIRLIKSIPRQYTESLYSKVINALQEGKNKKGLIHIIRETYPVPKKRAVLIARDQIGKINGNLTRIRQRNIGVDDYMWRTAKDERVRGNPAGSFPRAKYSHYHREGDRFSWEKPHDDGHPGHPIRCRCYGEPVLPLLHDLKEVIMYADKVWQDGFQSR